MAWTKTTRKQYRRDGLRYASDTTFEEWMLLSRLLPKQHRIGRPREVSLRGHGCDPLHSCDRLPMACTAEGLSTVHDGSILLLQLARQLGLAADQRYPCRARSPGGGT
jgi:hypothetical protein